jgi:GTP cyclohydrolase I
MTDADERILTAEAQVRLALLALDFPVDKEGMKDTPKRVVKAWLEMSAGRYEAAEKHLAVVFEGGGYDEAVALANIPFVSLCEHHMLPFSGVAGVAYLPEGRVVGLSKLARVVDVYSRRPQLQERLTAEIADAVEQYLAPKGVIVTVEATHSCMTCRGAMKAGAVMRTSALRGQPHTDGTLRAEMLDMLNRR